jgi:hypothetical protein
MFTEASANSGSAVRRLKFCCAALGLALLPAMLCHSQSSQPFRPQPSFSDQLPPPDNDSAAIHQRRLRQAEIERQKSLVVDTTKLLRLAAELNAEVSTTNPDILTAAQRRTVMEIEKLAHNIKVKMSYAEYGPPAFDGPGAPGAFFIRF